MGVSVCVCVWMFLLCTTVSTHTVISHHRCVDVIIKYHKKCAAHWIPHKMLPTNNHNDYYVFTDWAGVWMADYWVNGWDGWMDGWTYGCAVDHRMGDKKEILCAFWWHNTQMFTVTYEQKSERILTTHCNVVFSSSLKLTVTRFF